MDLRPGTLIAGRYRVERKVGAGGMGEVWAGEHVAIGVKVALKKLLPAAALDHQIVARFKREAFLLGRIKSDHVARVVDFIADNRFGLVLVMDFVEGLLLAQLLEERRLSVEETLELGVDIAEALVDLSKAHIVHRDLKPDNIIMEPREGGRSRAVLVDLGVSRLIAGEGDRDEDITGITHADMAVGTIAYMAPEQLLSSRDVTSASDVYALGAILYRAAAGQHVFGDSDDIDYATKKLSQDAEPLSLSRIDRVARGLQAVVMKALARKPEDRFESAAAMVAELIALRDVARAMALDLEATTEEAEALGAAVLATPRRSLQSTAPTRPRIKAAAPTLVSAALAPAPLPKIDRISDTHVAPAVQAATQASPRAHAGTQTSPRADGGARANPRPPRKGPALVPKLEPITAPESDPSCDEVTKLAIKGELGDLPPLVPDSNPPPSETALAVRGSEAPKGAVQGVPEVKTDPTAVPRRRVIAVVLAALVGGAAIGAVVHWGVGAFAPNMLPFRAPAGPSASTSAGAPRRR